MILSRATLEVKISAPSTKTTGLQDSSNPLSKSYSSILTAGTGADEADLVWHDGRTLAAGTSENLDLTGSLVDWAKDAADFVRVKKIIVRNNSETGTLTIGGAASNAWNGPFSSGGSITIGPGCLFVAEQNDATGWPVAAGTADKLKILNNDAASATYDIVLIGCTA